MTKRKRQHVEENSNNNNNNNNEVSKKFKTNHLDESRIDDISFELKKEEFVLTREVAEHTIVLDITGNKWRIGAPIGRGAFGEIFLASNDISHPVNTKNAQYVTKVEPHSNGPLFVEIHCLMNVNKKSEDCQEDHDTSLTEDVGIPRYIASGSHFFNDSRYRFLIMPRYKTDLHSIIKSGRLSHKHFLIVASQIIDVLMHLHNRNYVHSDIKAENIMLGSCDALETLSPSGRSRRTTNSIKYAFDEFARSSTTPESDESEMSDDDEDFELSPRKRKAKKNAKRLKKKSNARGASKCPLKSMNKDDEEFLDDRVYIIDYGLATKFVNSNGEHKPFCCDERRAHDGTLEFTSRDAHFGAHSRRSDLECLGYNLIYWSQGFLPWKDEKLKEQPEIVHRLKEVFMTDCKEILKILYGRDVPKYLGEFMLYVKGLEFDEEPNYAYLKGLFEKEFTKLGLKKSEMKLNISEMKKERVANEMTESDLMLSTITDHKTARKLGFLIATDAVDGLDLQTKSNESLHMNSSCKFSPKNLRSKEKTKAAKIGGKRQKRQPKMTEKEVVKEKIAQGKDNFNLIKYLF
jgi:serine/threonine protein kinase